MHHCEITLNGSRIRGPFVYNVTFIDSLIKDLGIGDVALPTSLSAPIAMGGYELIPVHIIKPDPSLTEDIHLLTRHEENGVVTYTFNTSNRHPNALRGQHTERVAAHHEMYEHQHAELQTVLIKADLEARINAVEILEKFKLGELTSVKWRGKNGKIEVNSTADMQAVYDTIFTYLQIGFIAKETSEDAIVAATDEELYDLDPIAVFNDTVSLLNA